MKLYEQQAEFALQISDLIKYIWNKGYKCTFADAYRSPEMAAIYAKQGKGIKNSLHCKRLALDLNLYSPEGIYLTDSKYYEEFGKYWESLDKMNRWGGYFKDPIGKPKPDGTHFERQEIK